MVATFSACAASALGGCIPVVWDEVGHFQNVWQVSHVKNLDPILAFVRVVEKKSFSAAAKDLKVSASVVSKLVGLLEKELGVDLLRRSTRRLVLTGPALNSIRIAHRRS